MGKKVSQDKRDKALFLMKEGHLTLSEISEEVGVAVGSISTWATKAGIKAHRGAGRPAHAHPSPDVIHLLETYFRVVGEEHASPYAETARRLGLRRQQIWSTVKKWEERGWTAKVKEGPYYAPGRTVRWKSRCYEILGVLSHRYGKVRDKETGEVLPLFRFDAGGCFAEVVDG